MEPTLGRKIIINVIKSYYARLLPLFLVLLFARIANAFLIFTVFAPDEYFQSVEVAHHIVFGYKLKKILIIVMRFIHKILIIVGNILK